MPTTFSNRSLCSNDTAESVGIFFTELLKQDQAQLAEKSISPHYLIMSGCEICGLLLNHCALVAELPENTRDDLCEIRFDTNAKRIEDRAEAVEHDLILCGLLLELQE